MLRLKLNHVSKRGHLKYGSKPIWFSLKAMSEIKNKLAYALNICILCWQKYKIYQQMFNTFIKERYRDRTVGSSISKSCFISFPHNIQYRQNCKSVISLSTTSSKLCGLVIVCASVGLLSGNEAQTWQPYRVVWTTTRLWPWRHIFSHIPI